MTETEYLEHKKKMDAIRADFRRDVWPKVKLPEGASDKQVAASIAAAWRKYRRENGV